jgi:hypothetical protein
VGQNVLRAQVDYYSREWWKWMVIHRGRLCQLRLLSRWLPNWWGPPSFWHRFLQIICSVPTVCSGSTVNKTKSLLLWRWHSHGHERQ